ncbi:MAG TPA: DUF1491 family protein [Rhizobiaceae bacterium]|nr:DUF1491 family protein [Rhizobiaceae bacterium]
MRLKSEIWVQALLRRTVQAGGFATVLRRGFADAGAIHVSVRDRSGANVLLSPAPQALIEEAQTSRRAFQVVGSGLSDEQVLQAIERELRLDPDFWLIEIEGVADWTAFLDVASEA